MVLSIHSRSPLASVALWTTRFQTRQELIPPPLLPSPASSNDQTPPPPFLGTPSFLFFFSLPCVFAQVLGDKAAEADKLFKGEPETALIASILWAFEVFRP